MSDTGLHTWFAFNWLVFILCVRLGWQQLSTVRSLITVERNCHFTVPGWNCMTHSQALQRFPHMSQVSLHKNNKIDLPMLYQFLQGAGKWQLRSTVSVNALYNFVFPSCAQHQCNLARGLLCSGIYNLMWLSNVNVTIYANEPAGATVQFYTRSQVHKHRLCFKYPTKKDSHKAFH
jgi:hypothetical protein